MRIDGEHGRALPAGLSRSSDKRDLYAADTYFWEGWEDLTAVAGQQAGEVAAEFTLLILKSDAIAGRKVLPTLNWLQEHGFRIVMARRFRFDRHLIRLLWFYQWNIATRERKNVVDLLLRACDSLLLVVRRPAGAVLPATVLFSTMKGPANPALREPHQLRYRLGQRCTLLNFIHSTDEPADLIRELSICLDVDERRKALQAMVGGDDAGADARALGEAIAQEVPAHDLSLSDTLARLSAALGGAPPGHGLERVQKIEAEAVGVANWRVLAQWVESFGAQYSLWDHLTIACHRVNLDYTQWKLLLPTVSRELWRA